MKQSLFGLCFCVMMITFFQGAYGVEKASINWLTNYEDAVNQSRAVSKPLLLFFTGSDWCGWCTKLEEEAFNSPDFIKAAGDSFVYVKIDFPLYKALPPQLGNQNKQLQKKLDVRSFPSIVILEQEHLQSIGLTGYRAGGGKPYANHLAKLVRDYNDYQSKMQDLEKKTLNIAELKSLHEKAKELGFDADAIRIVKEGMRSESPLYFLTERYRFLTNEGQVHDQETIELRQKILSLDPTNQHKTHYQVAVIDFEAYCEEMDREQYAPDLAVSPLVGYIEKFGGQDKDNLWRLQMIISQVYLDKNRLPDALRFAKSSYQAAPSSVQPDIALAIKNIQTQIQP